jgi:hypothetical protein
MSFTPGVRRQMPLEARSSQRALSMLARLTFVVAVIAAPAVATAVARAQSASGVASGARIRIDLPTTERSRFGRERVQSVVGMVEATRGDTVILMVRPGQPALGVPLTAATRLYVSRGRPPRWRAALAGAVAPAAVAAAMAAVSMSIHRKAGDPSPGSAAASGAAWAAASGAVIAAWSPRERWRRVAVARASALTDAITDGESRVISNRSPGSPSPSREHR